MKPQPPGTAMPVPLCNNIQSFQSTHHSQMFRRLLTLMSLNDPQWGRKGGNQGPPDLDELWRNFNRKLNGLFGKKNGAGGDGSGPSHPDFRQIGGGALILIFVVLGLWLASGFFIVDASQRAVV